MGPSYNLSPAKNLNCLAVQQRLVPSNSKLSVEAFEVLCSAKIREKNLFILPTNILVCLFKSYLDYQSLDKVWIMFLMIKNLKNPWQRGLRLMSSLFRIEKFVSFRHFNCDFKLPFSANIGAKSKQEPLYSILYSQAKRRCW